MSTARLAQVTFVLLALALAACDSGDSEATVENTAALCQDDLDNDGDGRVDCADPDCYDFVFCASHGDVVDTPDAGATDISPAVDLSAGCDDECGPAELRVCGEAGVMQCGDWDDDGCLEWSEAEACAANETCVNGACVCSPDCGDRVCGDDGCGGACGVCGGLQDECQDGLCVCVPACDERECGDDGCGGDCGTCEGDQATCEDGHCLCVPNCPEGACGDDGCGGTCPVQCQADEMCALGSCVSCGALCGDSEIYAIVRWDSSADIDLQAIEPGPHIIYYGDANGPNGQMAYDSNPACGGTDLRSELIVWPSGDALAGEYEVLVDFWSACGEPATNYAVEVGFCGEVLTFEGSFAAEEASGGGHCGFTAEEHAAQGCVVVAAFSYDPECVLPPCVGDADCADRDPCTVDTCDVATGDCLHETDPACCHVDADCDDGVACTEDRCLANVCVYEDHCCDEVADCDDRDPCTLDTCEEGRCRYAVDPACLLSLPHCQGFDAGTTLDDLGYTRVNQADPISETNWVIRRAEHTAFEGGVLAFQGTPAHTDFDECVVTPPFDASALTTPPVLALHHHGDDPDESDGGVRLRILVSPDNGHTWQEFWSRQDASNFPATHDTFILPAAAAAAPALRLAFCVSGADSSRFASWALDEICLEP